VKDYIEYPAICQSILKCLNDRSTSVRNAAIETLSPLVTSDADVRQAIFQCFDEPYWQSRSAAIKALSPLITSDIDIRQAIFQCLDDKYEYVRRTAVKVLSPLSTSDADIRQAIFQSLDDPNWQVRSTTLISFSKLESLELLEKDRRLTLLNWLGARSEQDRYGQEFEEAKERLQILYGLKLAGDSMLRDMMLDWLKSPHWPMRLDAIRTLLKWPGTIPKEILHHILESLNDTRGLESYPARL
jgi:hypothetical protein